MLEVDKMLHLRRYLTLVVRSQLRSPRCETAASRPREMRHAGYVLGYVRPRHASLRSEVHVATCSRTYGTTVSQSSPSDVVDHKLMSFCNDIKKGRVSATELKEVIGLCKMTDYQLPHDTGVLLLKCCGNLLPDLEATERNNLADQVWYLATKSGGALTVEYYNTLLDVNKANSKSVDPKKFLASMSVEPDESTYRLLLHAATEAADTRCLWDILSVIKDKNAAIYEEAINALVEICVTNNNVAEVERTITLLREAKLSTAKAYTELACGYAKLGDIPNLVKILNEESQDNANLLRIMKILSVSNNGRHIPVVLNFLVTTVPDGIESEISKMIVELIRADRIMDGHTVINCLAMNSATKDRVRSIVNSFMNELVILNAPVGDIIKYANDFIGCGCNQKVLTDVAEIGLKLGREKLCLAIFQTMRNNNMEIRPHYYWPLLTKAYHDKGEAEVYSLVNSMTNAGVEIDSETLFNYVYPYVNTADPIVALKKLLLINVPRTVSHTPLLCFLLEQNRLRDIVPLCTSYIHHNVYYRKLMKPLVRAYLATKNVEICIKILTAFPQGQDFIGMFLTMLMKVEHPIYIEDLQLLVEELKMHKFKISQEDGIILKNRLQKNTNFNFTTKVKNLINDLVDPSIKDSVISLHPRYMDTKTLACYLVEMKNKGANTENVLQRLLVAYCIENNLKKAEEIKQEYDAEQYELPPRIKMILFELYLKHNKLNEAEALLPNLQIMPEEFHINRIKIVMYAIALVKADQFTKAFDVIDTLNIFDSKADAQAQCCTLLEVLAKSRYHECTIDMLNLLLQKNYCKITIDLLKPLVMIPLQRGNVLDAVNVLAECAKKYQKTPLALEVLIILLEQKYSSRLQNASNYIEQVYDIIATTNSVIVANTLLMMALATLNQTEKVQALLQDHKLSMNSLVYNINNTTDNNVMDGLLNLLKIADANHLDQNVICRTLLSTFSKMGDCHRALELWKIMCTKNIQPNEQFKKNFIQFLMSNKIPLPSELDRIKMK